MDLGLAERVAIVTGAGQGIGAAIARALAAEGAAVVVHYLRSAAGAEAVAAEIRGGGGRALALAADLRDDAAVAGLVERALAEFGRLDVLVNNAGYALHRPFLEQTPEDWAAQIDVSLVGVLRCCRAALPTMIERRTGAIVNVVSDAGRVGEARWSVNSAARAGVIGFTRALAKEVGRHGVRVNAVAPALTRTALTEDLIAARGADLLRLYPLRRFGEPEDIARAVCFLASPAAGWITGQTLSVNGGYSMV